MCNKQKDTYDVYCHSLIFMGVFLFVCLVFFLGSLSYGRVAVEYCDESMVKNSTIQSSKEEYKSQADSLGYFNQIDQVSHYCFRLQKPVS